MATKGISQIISSIGHLAFNIAFHSSNIWRYAQYYFINIIIFISISYINVVYVAYLV